MKNKEEEIVIKLCDIMGVHYSHYDNHKMGLNYFQHHNLTSIPKIVVYSSEYGPWEFSVLEDMTIITPMSNFYDTILKFSDYVGSEKHQDSEKFKKALSDISVETENIKKAEKYLKDNNCSDIINDKSKSINWI